METTLENANPTIFQQKKERDVLPEEEDEEVVDKIDEREVFDILYPAIASIWRLSLSFCTRLTLGEWVSDLIDVIDDI